MSEGSDHEEVLFKPDDEVAFRGANAAGTAPAPAPSSANHTTADGVGLSDNGAAPEKDTANSERSLESMLPASGRTVPGSTQTKRVPEAAPADQALNWTAAEYDARQKPRNWYVGLGAAAVVVAAIVWLFTRDPFPTLTVCVGIILLGIYANHQPRQESYSLDDKGFTVGSRCYYFSDYRSFAIMTDGPIPCIEFSPLKRFGTYMAIYYNQGDEVTIVNLISSHLPLEMARGDMTERLMRRLHL